MTTWVLYDGRPCQHRVVVMHFDGGAGVLLPGGPTSILAGSHAPTFTVAQLDMDANSPDSAFTVEKNAYVVIQYMVKHVPELLSQVEMQLVAGEQTWPGWAVPAGAFLGTKTSTEQTGPFNVELRMGSTLGTTILEWYLKADIFIPISL